MKNQLIQKIKKNNLIGRGGAGFPVGVKWESVQKSKGQLKYVICNASEGELGVFKDLYILEHFPEDVLRGMVLSMDYLGTKAGYFNLNQKYFQKIRKKFLPLLSRYEKKGYRFTIFQEHPSYIGGEETALLNAIEGRRVEPRLKPPFPGESGLFGKPTLIHNVETLFNISRTAEDRFEPKRFYCLSGKISKPGVYHLPDSWTIGQILKETGNLPSFPFFVQIGGGASGVVLNERQTRTEKMTGAGSLQVYPMSIKPIKMLRLWFKFYAHESCGKCTPCREGSYQLWKLVKNAKTIPWKKIMEIVEIMGKTSFCALGKSIAIPVKSYRKNVLNR